ncbi:hypothetical protein LCGC14_1927790, partial [marine sediment metagenome]
SPQGWLLSNDGTDSTVWRTLAIGELSYASVDLLDEFQSLRHTGVVQKLYAHTSIATLFLRDSFSVLASNSSPTVSTFVLVNAVTYLIRVSDDIKFSGTGRHDGQWQSNNGTYSDRIRSDNIQFFNPALGAIPADDTTFLPEHTGYNWTITGNGSALSLRFLDSAYGDNSGSFTVQLFEVTTDTSATRYSEDDGASFAAQDAAGSVAAAGGAFAVNGAVSTKIMVAIDAKIREQTGGGAFSDTTDGGSAGTYAKAIVTVGAGSATFIAGSAIAFSGMTLWHGDGTGQTDLTPNDGVDNGIVVGPHAIAVAPQDVTAIFALCDFGGTTKLAYSSDGGATWAFNTTVTNNATAIVALNANILFITDGNVIYYSNDGGATLTAKSSPSSALLGIVIK